MKYLIRVFLFNTFSLWMASEILPALSLHGDVQTTLLAGFVLSILMLGVAPILRILFIPINILTFGLLSWFINVIVLYLLTLFVPEVEILPWNFPGVSWFGFTIPAFVFSYFLSLVVSSLVVTLLSNIFHAVSEG